MTIKRKFSPVCSDDRLLYQHDGDVITVTHEKYTKAVINENGETVSPVLTIDTFDFTSFPDGEADVTSIQTGLPVNPFVSAKRVDGILEVVLINYHGVNASEEERFPKWEVIQ